MSADRRKQSRLQPVDVTFVVMRPNFAQLGRLLNISEDGLCFQYTSHSEAIGDSVKNATDMEIDMFIGNNRYYLPMIPCKLIYDIEKEREMAFPNGLTFGCCGIQFREFTKNQSDQLELYIRNYTSEMV